MRGPLAMIAAASMLVSGCSLVFMESTSPMPLRPTMPRCTAHRGLVVVDGTAAVTMGLAALVLATNDDDVVARVAPIIYGIPAVIFAASAIIGTMRASDCTAAQEGHEAWLTVTPASDEPAPSGPPGQSRP